MGDNAEDETEPQEPAAPEDTIREGLPIPPEAGVGQIVSVTGRGSDGSRGLPPVHEVTISHDNGTQMTFGTVRERAEGAIDVRGVPVGVADPWHFGRCPICFSTENLTKEHVPQGDLGGVVMTRTCARCNSQLGSIENELRDWFDDAIGHVRFKGDALPGARKSPRVLLREAENGDFCLIPDTGKTEDLAAIMRGGGGEMSYSVPDPRLYRLAMLKHAYLAACLLLGGIAKTPLADQVRADLLAAREWTRGEPFPVSDIAGSLRFCQSHVAAHGPAVVLVELVDEQEQVRDRGISLAGTLYVSWPLEPEVFQVLVNRWHAGLRPGEAAPST